MVLSSPVGEAPAKSAVSGRSRLGVAWVYQHRIARVATVSAGGEPHCVPVIYAYDVRGNGLWFMSRADTRKVRNLRATGTAALSIDDPQAIRGVSLAGTTTVVGPGQRLDNITSWLRERGVLRADRDLTGQVAVCLVPERWSEWGLDDGPRETGTG